MAQSLSRVLVHLVFSTKNREPFIAIVNQEKNHRDRDFKNEFREMLRANEIEWDERYVWD